MMNLKPKAEAEKVVEKVFELIDEQNLYLRINQPIEEAALSFGFDEKTRVTHHTFHHLISNFVRHICQKGVGIQQTMTDSQAHAEAVFILETGYQNLNSIGYYAAFLDAINPQLNGFNVVLTQLTEIITTQARTEYIRWVFATCIDSLSWETRRLITEILLERWEPFLPPSILRCSPAQLADHLPELINILNAVDETAHSLTGFYRD